MKERRKKKRKKRKKKQGLVWEVAQNDVTVECFNGVGGKRGSTDSDCGGGSHNSTRVDIKWRIQRKRKVVNILPLT